jgi:hypothetical protein
MPIYEIVKESTLEEVESAARLLWRGQYGFSCPNCSVSVYGKSVEWCHAHLLEHLVETIRGKKA